MAFTHLPPATHHPARDPSWLTEGGEIARVAGLMGVELMPWQRKAVDVATEYRLDASGQRRYRYREVIITVPRQSGKTTLVGPVQCHRVMTRPRSSAFFTAQTGKDARKRMGALIDLVVASPARYLFKPVRAAGGSGLLVPGNGASLLHFAPTKSALHGETPWLVTFDEFWKYDTDLGTALEGAASPGQITLGSRSQLWWISTKGTADSTFMNDKLAAAADDPTMCVIEYSAPDGADVYDPATWWRYHPALGNTIAEEDIQRETRLPKAEFIRAYANRLVLAETTLIDLDDWDALASPWEEPPADTSEVTLAFEAAPDNAAAAVVAAWRNDTGHQVIRTVHSAPGTAWLVPFASELATAWGVELVCDGAGPVARHATDLEDRGHTVRRLTMAEFGQASEGLISAARDDQTIRHVPVTTETGEAVDAFRDEIAAAQVRTTNGVARLSRDHSSRPIPNLIAAAVGAYAHDHAPESYGLQLFA
ncbi:terminase large subunit domain-containing protein [Kocuria sp.]|uniref:terminase large subunit domain-containing protein n=1 Tax=Kocuria sp. TaxID=1871328 RepID=UPI0026DEE7EF|nr:terminase family protein [Kocuria sp.]MDO5618027.1 terminase large subunit [Kocuria sp.]